MTTALLTPPEITDATRRQLLWGGAALTTLAVVGCGTPDEPDAAAPRTRVITSANGPVWIPLDPQRVVALDPVTTEHLAALGVSAVGATVEGFFEPLALLQPDAAHVLGADGTPNIELIASLQPDLIVGWPPFVEGFGGRLDDVGPIRGDLPRRLPRLERRPALRR